MPPAQQVKLFEEAKRLAEDSVQILERSIASPKGPGRIQALRAVPAATRVYFWASVSWGQWAADHKIAAAWQGAAIRMRARAVTIASRSSLEDDTLRRRRSPRIVASFESRVVVHRRWIRSVGTSSGRVFALAI